MSQNRCNPNNMIMIYYWDKRNGDHLEHIHLKCILWARDIKLMGVFFKLSLYQLPGHAIFFWFLTSIINYYHINGRHLFETSFQWFCLQISSGAKYFFSCPRHLWSKINSCDRILFSNQKQKRTQLYYQ